MLLGKKQYDSMVDNPFGKKLGIAMNRLGGKHSNSKIKKHMPSNEKEKEYISPLEKR